MLPAVEWSKKWTLPLKGIKTRDHPNHGDEKFEALCDVCTGCQHFFIWIHMQYTIYILHRDYVDYENSKSLFEIGESNRINNS